MNNDAFISMSGQDFIVVDIPAALGLKGTQR